MAGKEKHCMYNNKINRFLQILYVNYQNISEIYNIVFIQAKCLF